VVRAGKPIQVELPVSPQHPMVIPNLAGAYPSYFVCGPLVFSAATEQFIRGFASGARSTRWMNWLTVQGSPLMTRLGDQPASSGEELVVVPRAEMFAATDEILTDNGVRSQGSADTLAIWNTKPAP